MKNNINVGWVINDRDENGNVEDYCKKNLYLLVRVTAPDEKTASNICDQFENELNRLIESETAWSTGYMEWCASWEETINCLPECMVFEKEEGYVSEQRSEIRKLATIAKNNILSKVRDKDL